MFSPADVCFCLFCCQPKLCLLASAIGIFRQQCVSLVETLCGSRASCFWRSMLLLQSWIYNTILEPQPRSQVPKCLCAKLWKGHTSEWTVCQWSNWKKHTEWGFMRLRLAVLHQEKWLKRCLKIHLQLKEMWQCLLWDKSMWTFEQAFSCNSWAWPVWEKSSPLPWVLIGFKIIIWGRERRLEQIKKN